MAMDGQPTPIGVIGVGNMGLGMALRLRDLGWPVVVHDVLPEREALAAAGGAAVAASPAALAVRCDTVLVAVVDAAQTREVLQGPRGLLKAARPPRQVLLCPTIAPSDVQAAATALAAAGVGCIDAPMSGGPARARDGSMSLMVACPARVFEAERRLLSALSARLFHVGERPGDGARTKLVNNLLAAVNLAGAAEALALAQRLGLDGARTLQVIEQSSGQSWIGSDRLARALAGDLAPRAHLRLLAKDSGLALAMAVAAGAEPAVGRQAAALFRAACDDGLAGADDAALLGYVAEGWPAAPELPALSEDAAPPALPVAPLPSVDPSAR